MNSSRAQAIVSMMVVLMFGAVIVLLVAKPITLDGSLKDLMMIMVGSLGTNFTTVISYYMGSSTGSKRANEALSQIASSGTGNGS